MLPCNAGTQAGTSAVLSFAWSVSHTDRMVQSSPAEGSLELSVGAEWAGCLPWLGWPLPGLEARGSGPAIAACERRPEAPARQDREPGTLICD